MKIGALQLKGLEDTLLISGYPSNPSQYIQARYRYHVQNCLDIWMLNSETSGVTIISISEYSYLSNPPPYIRLKKLESNQIVMNPLGTLSPLVNLSSQILGEDSY